MGHTSQSRFGGIRGARLVSLEKFPATDERLYDDAFVRGRIPAAPVTFQTISQLFYDSLAISAWKSTGEHSWALRVNPSSGNLHPTEGYLICGPIDGLGDRPMVCHYAPKEHGLEVRAEFERGMWDGIVASSAGGHISCRTDLHSIGEKPGNMASGPIATASTMSGMRLARSLLLRLASGGRHRS